MEFLCDVCYCVRLVADGMYGIGNDQRACTICMRSYANDSPSRGYVDFWRTWSWERLYPMREPVPFWTVDAIHRN